MAKSEGKSGLRSRYRSNLQLFRFRLCFFTIMCYNWLHIVHSPCNPWEKAFKYYHTTDICPPNEFWATATKYGGGVVCALATFSNPAAVVFAVLQNVYVFSYITRFVNHEYLFGLLAVLMVFLIYSKGNQRKLAVVQALRGQICVVYFYAALWKVITPAWLDGTICRGIFLSFEEQGVASGVPWSQLERQIPHLFVFLAWSGLLLDALIATVLLFARVGHWIQQVAVVFHGFTALTMAQRIGYAFPATMLAAGLLFRPVDGEEADDNNVPSKTTVKLSSSHVSWMRRNWKHHPLVTMWLIGQWLMPARMPIVSKGRYKYTGEGYRFSWTMMLHERNSFSNEAFSNFLTLRLYCGEVLFTREQDYPAMPILLDTKGYPIHSRIGLRGLAALNMFPRQLSAIGHKVSDELSQMSSCKHPDGIAVYGSMFVSVDQGPYHRVVDPEQDLVQTHEALVGRSFASTMIGSLLDFAPKDVEFILKDVGSYWDANLLPTETDLVDQKEKWIYIVDRLPCLAADPIAIFGRAIEFVVVKSPEPLVMEWCKDLAQTDCTKETMPWNEGQPPQQPMRTPPLAVIKFRSANETKYKSRVVDRSCRSGEEDVVIKLRIGPQWAPPKE